MNVYVYVFVCAHVCIHVCERQATCRGDPEKYVYFFFGQVLVMFIFIHASSLIYFETRRSKASGRTTLSQYL